MSTTTTPFSIINHDLAAQFGVHAAAVIHTIRTSIKWNIRNRSYYREGYHWFAGSVRYLHKKLSFLSREQIYRILRQLVNKKILIKSHFNRTGYDRTAWYAFNANSPCAFDIPEGKVESDNMCQDGQHGLPESHQIAPDRTTENYAISEAPAHEENSVLQDEVAENPRGCTFGSSATSILQECHMSYIYIDNKNKEGRGDSAAPPPSPIQQDDNEMKEETMREETTPKAINDAAQKTKKDESPKTKKDTKKRESTKLPEDWRLPNEWRSWSKRIGMAEGFINTTELKFKNYWLGDPKNSSKKNWFLTWQNWCLSDMQRTNQDINYDAAHNPTAESPVESLDDTLADFPSHDQLVKQWYALQEKLRDLVGKESYAAWFRDLKFMGIKNGTAYFVAGSSFKAQELDTWSKKEQLLHILQQLDPEIMDRDIHMT